MVARGTAGPGTIASWNPDGWTCAPGQGFIGHKAGDNTRNADLDTERGPREEPGPIPGCQRL